MTRLSVALWPPPSVVAVLISCPRPTVSDVRWSSPAQWMVKVRPLGHVDERLVPGLLDALQDGLAGAPAVACVLGPATRRIAGQWLGVTVSGLDEVAAAVFGATEPVVPVTHPQAFAADVVLAWGRVPADLAGAPLQAAWTARSIALVADRSSPRSPRFEDLAVVPLGST